MGPLCAWQQLAILGWRTEARGPGNLAGHRHRNMAPWGRPGKCSDLAGGHKNIESNVIRGTTDIQGSVWLSWRGHSCPGKTGGGRKSSVRHNLIPGFCSQQTSTSGPCSPVAGGHGLPCSRACLSSIAAHGGGGGPGGQHSLDQAGQGFQVGRILRILGDRSEGQQAHGHCHKRRQLQDSVPRGARGGLMVEQRMQS